MSAWLNLKFYILIGLYTIYYLVLHFISQILRTDKTEEKNPISVPPKCLTTDGDIHRYAKLSHTKYHYVERGNRNNRLLLLIHGYPEFWYSWRFQLRNLSNYYWVVAIDMKGFGDSDKPVTQSEYDINVLVRELSDFIQALGRTRCSIVTHGMGGLIGWYFLNQYPETVDNFISISSPHPLSFLQELSLGRVHDQGWYYFCPITYYPEKRVMRKNLEVFNKMYAKMVNSKRGNMTQQDIQAFKYTFSRLDDWIGPLNYFRVLLLRQRKYKKPLKKSIVPTLFIVGNSDPYCSLEMICKSSEYVENFTLKIVEGGGHFLPQEMPNYNNSLILDFMKAPEPPGDVGEDWADGSLFKKMIGAGKTVWSTSKDAMTKGYNIPKKLASNQAFLTLD